MTFNRPKKFTFLALAFPLFMSCASNNTSHDSSNTKLDSFEQAQVPIQANVPYSKIAELTPSSEHSKLVYGDDPENYILHWQARPYENAHLRPLNIVFLHGGCWLEQFSIEHSLPFTEALAKQGFNVYSIEYRRTGNGGEWPVALEDVLSAIQTIQSKIKQSSMQVLQEQEQIQALVENQALVLMGHSAGGHIASLAALELAKTRPNISYVGLAPIMDIDAYSKGNNSCQTATPAFMGGAPNEREQQYTAASPLNQDFTNVFNASIFAGGKDTIVPLSMVSHPDAALVVAPNAGHFDWIHPRSNAFKQLSEHLYRINIVSNEANTQ